MSQDLFIFMQEFWNVVSPFRSELFLFFLAVVVHRLFIGTAVVWNQPKKVSPSREAAKKTPLLAKSADSTRSEHHAPSRVGATESSKHTQAAVVRAAAGRGDLNSALGMARTTAAGVAPAPKGTAGSPAQLLGAALEGCLVSKRPQDAQAVLFEMQEAGCAEATAYRSVIKAWLAAGKFTCARHLLSRMLSAGVEPSASHYNELLAHITKSSEGQLGGPRHAAQSSGGMAQQALALVDEMRAAGISPNRITASILLKTLGARSPPCDVTRTLEVVDSLQERMDEVLLSSVIEACVRVGKVPLIQERLRYVESPEAPTVTTATTCGTLIKAYGVVRDIEGAWRVWGDLRASQLKLSSITIGCMVEAIVSNGDADGGHDLIVSLLEDRETRDQINSVIFGSVLKGYSHSKRTDTMWSVFREMVGHGIQPTAVTFNLLVDACARNGQMQRVPDLLEDMASKGFKPNLITHSSIIKGFCASGEVGAALGTLKKMRQETNFKADEIVYNTLIDGCVQASMTAEAERLYQEMLSEGVAPTNYTVTRMVKAFGQAKRMNDAFDLAAKASERYRVRLNAYVYNALLHAAFACRDFTRALDVLKDMEAARHQPEPRVLQNLVLALISAGRRDDAVRLVLAHAGDSSSHGDRSQSGALDRRRRKNVEAEQHHTEEEGVLARSFLYKVFSALSSAGPDGEEHSRNLSAQLRKLRHGISLPH